VERPKTTKNVGQPCVICGQSADAQAAIAALQAQLTQLDRTLADVYAQREGLQKDLAQRTAELERVRALVKTYADAKIDFDDKRLQEDHHAWRERYNKLVEAENALLQHRQGMEG
jgi:chromosome segregation ATPase